MDSILIAGADGFLGRNTVSHFLKKKNKVIGTYWKTSNKDDILQWLQKTGVSSENLTLFQANLSSEKEIQTLVRQAENIDPVISQLVNCGGGFEWVKVADSTREQVDFLMQANFYSNWALLKGFLPKFYSRNRGRVVLISAAASQQPAVSGMGPYLASKAAVNALIQAAADESKNGDVRVRAVYPTIIDTPRNRLEMPDADFKQWMTVESVVALIDKALI